MSIIQSFLDTDFYKFTMGQLVWRKYRDIPVRLGFINRTKGVRLAEYISEFELRKELDAVRMVTLTREEHHYLASIRNGDTSMFCPEYLEFLKEVKLSPYELEERDGYFRLEFAGAWSAVMHWEVPALAIINELYSKGVMVRMDGWQTAMYGEGHRRLMHKVDILKGRPDVVWCDFGTRRRHSREWQEFVVASAARELSATQFVGTSNTYLAMKNCLTPMGTCAHEVFKVLGACAMGRSDEELAKTPRQVLRDWWKEYGYGLSIALTDTWGSPYFLQQVFPEYAYRWKGVRQDSGDPFQFGETMIQFYEGLRIQPREKMIVFSDGLELETILALTDVFKDRIRVTFGWGTNLTNDLGVPPLSIVIKVIEAGGYGAVKLSDNPAKAVGKPEDIARVTRAVNYSGGISIPCKY